LALAKKTRPEMRIVVIDPRQTATCDIADLHLALRPGSDAALFCGALQAMAEQQHLDENFLQQHTQGLTQTLAAVESWTLAKTAAFCGLSSTELQLFYQWIADSDRLVTL
ncbi:molybdopterin-dependent oxidoreductase, partial [Rosenbergiella nectarea]